MHLNPACVFSQPVEILPPCKKTKCKKAQLLKCRSVSYALKFNLIQRLHISFYEELYSYGLTY
jgi:hypothetical protein